jgi:hypothetical protein
MSVEVTLQTDLPDERGVFDGELELGSAFFLAVVLNNFLGCGFLAGVFVDTVSIGARFAQLLKVDIKPFLEPVFLLSPFVFVVVFFVVVFLRNDNGFFFDLFFGRSPMGLSAATFGRIFGAGTFLADALGLEDAGFFSGMDAGFGAGFLVETGFFTSGATATFLGNSGAKTFSSNASSKNALSPEMESSGEKGDF